MSSKKITAGILPKFYEPLGKIAVNFEKIDYFLSLAINILLAGEFARGGKGEIVTAKMNFDRKVALLKSLYEHANPKEMFKHNTFDSIITSVRKAQKLRNNLLHATWGTDGDQNSSKIIKVNTKDARDIHFDFETILVREIEKIANFLDQVAQALADFLPIILPPETD